MDLVDGLLQGIKFLPSPNYTARPEQHDISLLVIHSISLPPGEFGQDHIDAYFTNQLDAKAHPYFEQIVPVKVSAHVLINRAGELTQYVSFADRAWHAGVSSFKGREACNDFSIGVELEGTDEQAYTQAQYESLAKLAKILMQAYPSIIPEHIVGHSDISPGRKTDPGPSFDWDYFFNLLQQHSQEQGRT